MSLIWFGTGFMFLDQATQSLCSQSKPVGQTESWSVEIIESYPTNNEQRYQKQRSNTHSILIF